MWRSWLNNVNHYDRIVGDGIVQFLAGRMWDDQPAFLARHLDGTGTLVQFAERRGGLKEKFTQVPSEEMAQVQVSPISENAPWLAGLLASRRPSNFQL